MRYCDNCDVEHTNIACPKCGRRNPSRRQPRDEGHEPRVVSVPDDKVDDMIEEAAKAHRPTLASLVKRGIQRGLITPIQDYAHHKK